MIDRRLFMLSAAAFAACQKVDTSIPFDAKRMSITVDDFTQSFATGLSLEERHANILEAFDVVGHKAAGFVTGRFVDNEWGRGVVEDWLSRGHEIGNHTWSHPHADEMSTTEYLADIAKNKAYLSSISGTNAYFRFPYLDDGKDRSQQTALFSGIKDMGLQNAPVTIDTIDWFTNSRLEKALRNDPNADLTPYREYYVEMCVKLSNHADDVGRRLGNIGLTHLMLIHHNVLNGLFLKDVLLALKADGWFFEDAKTTLSMRGYHEVPSEPTKGRSWLTMEGKRRGVTPPPYPVEYRGFGRKTMDALGL